MENAYGGPEFRQEKNMQKANGKQKNALSLKQRAAMMLAAVLLLCSGCGQKQQADTFGLTPDTAEMLLDDLPSSAEESEAGILSKENERMAEAGRQTESETEVLFYVYVCGAVASPGVYALPKGARVYEAIQMAGGFLPEADEQWLNQAELLSDGQQLRVYTREEVSQMDAAQIEQSRNSGSSAEADSASGGSLVNLNTATKEELMTLPGIGEAKALAILQYRSEHGGFGAIEEIQEISGIKSAVFSKIRDRITVQ